MAWMTSDQLLGMKTHEGLVPVYRKTQQSFVTTDLQSVHQELYLHKCCL